MDANTEISVTDFMKHNESKDTIVLIQMKNQVSWDRQLNLINQIVYIF